MIAHPRNLAPAEDLPTIHRDSLPNHRDNLPTHRDNLPTHRP